MENASETDYSPAAREGATARAAPAGASTVYADPPRSTAPIDDPAASPSSEADEIVRRRLRMASTLVAVLNLNMALAMSWPYHWMLDPRIIGRAPAILAWATTLIMAGTAALLHFRRDIGGRPLRAVRLIPLAAISLFVAVWSYAKYQATPPDGGAAARTLMFEAVHVHAVLMWAFLILGFALLAPDPPRAILRIALWITALAIGTALAGAPFRELPAVTVRWSLEMGLSVLAGACAVAYFGARRVDRLREEVRAIRRELRDLGQYRLKAPLGAGGMGEVWLAEHRLLKRPCAVKLIRPQHAADSQFLRRFEREAAATARLQHPNIVAVYDFGRHDDGTFFLVMEYLEGANLNELIKREGPQPPARTALLLAQVCRGLGAAHAAGLVHRDVKPANLFLLAEGPTKDFVKILDFGLVQDRSEAETDARLTRDGAILGTPAFMSPEQADGAAAIGPASDLYAIGAVGYFLLAGRPPFVRAGAMQTLAAQLRDDPEPFANLGIAAPPALEQLIMQCLAKDPAHRPADALELAKQMEKFSREP